MTFPDESKTPGVNVQNPMRLVGIELDRLVTISSPLTIVAPSFAVVIISPWTTGTNPDSRSDKIC